MKTTAWIGIVIVILIFGYGLGVLTSKSVCTVTAWEVKQCKEVVFEYEDIINTHRNCGEVRHDLINYSLLGEEGFINNDIIT